MKLHKNMYWGENAGTHRMELLWKLKHGQFPKDAYILVLPPETSSNLLELIPAEEIGHLKVRALDSVIVGISEDKAEAMKVAAQIVDDVYQKTHSLAIRAYFAKR